MTRSSLIVTAAALALGASSGISIANASSSDCHGGYRMGANQVFLRCDARASMPEPATTGSIGRVAPSTGVSRGAGVPVAPSVMVGAPAECHPGGYWMRDMAAGDGTLLEACPVG